MSERRSRRPTIREVAAAAGLSPKTVSFAINNKPGVDPKTRELVAREASRLGYKPSRHARSLRGCNTATLALVLSTGVGNQNLQFSYYMSLAMAAASSALVHDYALLLAPSDDASSLTELEVDGVLLCDPDKNDTRIAMLEDNGVPVVSIERDCGRPEHRWYVDGDNMRSTKVVLDHLAERGARSIAFLATARPWAFMLDSLSSYREWCETNDRRPLVVDAALPDIYISGRREMAKVLRRRDRPDAVYAPSERHSGAILRAAHDAGLRVPDDLLVVCGSDCPEAQTSDPPVTALDLHADARGEAAVELMLDRLQGRTPLLPRVVSPDLRQRASTAPAPVKAKRIS